MTDKFGTDYESLALQLKGVLAEESNWLVNTSHFNALIYNGLAEVNWAGFYFLHNEALIVGPYQGKLACNPIPITKGVCGLAARTKETQMIADVHQIPDHIACDAASNSEIVIPLIKDSELIGVYDIDSPLHGRFDEEDKSGLSHLVAQLLAKTNFQPLTKLFQ